MNAAKTQPAYLAAAVASEDLACGDFVTILNEVIEFPSFLWCGYAALGEVDELVRMQFCAPDGGTPLRVEAICLPFVFLKAPQGRYSTVDVRQVQLVRLHRRYARLVWRQLKRQATGRDASSR